MQEVANGIKPLFRACGEGELALEISLHFPTLQRYNLDPCYVWGNVLNRAEPHPVAQYGELCGFRRLPWRSITDNPLMRKAYVVGI